MIELTAAAQELIKRICGAYAGQLFEEEKVERFRPVDLCRAEQRLALWELRQAGMLVTLQKMWGEKLYYIPEERLAMLQRYCFPFTQPKVEASISIQTTVEEGPGLAVDLFKALLFVAQTGLPVTAKGSIHKKYITQLESMLYLQEKHLLGLDINNSFTEKYPLPAAMILDLMLSLGLIKQGTNAFTVEAEALESWLQLPEYAMSDIIYRALANGYGNSEPANQHFRQIITRPEFRRREWVSISSILDWMEASLLSVPEYRQALEASSHAWIECLAVCGWCQLGSDTAGRMYFRWMKPQPQPHMHSHPALDGRLSPTDKFIIQPDFEVLVPPDVPYSIRWSLAFCAELLTVDAMWTFRLTQEQLVLASEQGMSPEEVISWLDAYTEGGLPREVKLVLDRWGDEIGRTSFSEVLLLTCRNERDGDAIAAHPRLQHTLSRLGPVSFVVPTNCEENVRRELTAAGLAPHREVHGREAAKPERLPLFHRMGTQPPGQFVPRFPAMQPGGRSTGAPQLYLQPAPLEKEIDLFTGEANIPSMWSKEWHRYHTTTAQKIMEQALLWGIKVRIKLGEQILEFLPERVVGNPWRIIGYLLDSAEGTPRQVELAAGSWKEMQLIIPSFRTNSSSVEATGYVMIREST